MGLSEDWGSPRTVELNLGFVVPDTVSLIIWLIGGIAGGLAVADLLRIGHPARNLISGAAGGVGSQILQLLIPALRGSNIVAIVGQMIGAFAIGAALTVVASAIIHRRQRERRRGSSKK
jgi:NADPH-dependent curcumin reductase CurA